MAPRLAVLLMAALFLASAVATATDDDGDGILFWSELLGKTGKEAKAFIEKKTGHTNVYYVPHGVYVTDDYRWDRVRIYVDAKYIGEDENADVIYENAKVISVPRVG
ncbi:unnamed protein product [Alopecurus aequalis]